MRNDGFVKWFDDKKGFGFIQMNNSEDIFVHYKAIEGIGHRSLYPGQKVSFDIVQGQKGRQAENLKIIK